MDFQDLTSFSLVEPTVYTDNVSMGIAVNFFEPGKLGPLVARGCTVTFTVMVPLTNIYDRRWRISVSKSLRLSVEMRRACFRV